MKSKDAATEKKEDAQEKKHRTEIERCLLDIQEAEQRLSDFIAERKDAEVKKENASSVSQRSQMAYVIQAITDEIEVWKEAIAEYRVKLQQSNDALRAIESKREILPAMMAKAVVYNKAVSELLRATDDLIATSQEARNNGADVRVLALLHTAAGYLNHRFDLLPRAFTKLHVEEGEFLRAVVLPVADTNPDSFYALEVSGD